MRICTHEHKPCLLLFDSLYQPLELAALKADSLPLRPTRIHPLLQTLSVAANCEPASS
jgi:hypothetical protein